MGSSSILFLPSLPSLTNHTARENGIAPEGNIPLQDQSEILADVQGQFPGQIDMMFHLDPSAPGLEDAYMMGPMFTWDPNFDFMPSTP